MKLSITSTRQAIIIALLVLVSVSIMSAQPTATNRGRDFYCSFIPNFHESARSVSDIVRFQDSLFIFIGSDIPTSGIIYCTNRNGQTVQYPFQITNPTQIYSFAIQWQGYELEGWNDHGIRATDSINQAGVVAKQHFRIVSNDDVTVYALNQASRTSDAFLLLPVNALGTEYRVLCYPSDGFLKTGLNEIDPISTPSEFSVTAAQDNTRIIINPTNQTVRHGITPDTVLLQRGESYLVQANITLQNLLPDLTGSRIIADKPIAVFAGHQRALLPVELRNKISSRDHLVEQMPPLSAWGKSAILAPYPQPTGITSFGSDLYRVLAAYDSTEVFIGGVKKITLSAGKFFTDALTKPAELTSSKPVLVSQYKRTSTGAGSGNSRIISDPFMMIIPPKEQFMLSYRCINAQAQQLNAGAPASNVYTEQYIIVVAPQTTISTVRLDGSPVNPALFYPVAGSTFAVATIASGDGTHSLSANEPFGIYVFGYGYVNSYGYVGGMSFREFDFQEPEISTYLDCFTVRGVALDTHRTDSRLDKVTAPVDSQKNVTVSIEPFKPYTDSVHFSATLTDPFQDGECTIVAKDSIGFITSKTVKIPGFTLRTDSILPKGQILNISTDGPLKRTYCFPIKIQNYGSFPQTISNTTFASNSGNFSVSTVLPMIIPPNSSADITVCFYSDRFGVFHDTLSIGNKCLSTKLATMTVRAIPDSVPPVIRRIASPCPIPVEISISESLPSDLGVATISFIDSLTKNCSIEVTTGQGYQTLQMTVTPTNPDEDAFFAFNVVDSAGNSSTFRDTIPGFTVRISIPDSPLSVLDFGETILGHINCQEAQIENYGQFPLDFGHPSLLHNNIFSIPPTQQDNLLLLPNQKRIINVCYAPVRVDNFTQSDTMVFYFGCRVKMLLLEGTPKPIVQTLNSRCDIPVKIITTELPQFYGVSTAYLAQSLPNPTSTTADISFAFSEQTAAKITLYDSMGNPLSTLAEGDFARGTYRISVNVQSYPDGIYFYQLQTQKERITHSILLTH
jgi:hypothetical protein